MGRVCRGMGGCLAPYLIEIGHGVISKLGSLDRCRRGGPAVTRRASPVFVRADSISTMDITLPSPNRPGCLSACVRARVISKRGLDLLRLVPTTLLHPLGAMSFPLALVASGCDFRPAAGDELTTTAHVSLAPSHARDLCGY